MKLHQCIRFTISHQLAKFCGCIQRPWPCKVDHMVGGNVTPEVGCPHIKSQICNAGVHRSCGRWDIKFLICQMTWHNQMVIWHFGWVSVIVNYHTVKFRSYNSDLQKRRYLILSFSRHHMRPCGQRVL